MTSYSWAHIEKAFTNDECDYISEYGDKLHLDKGLVGEKTTIDTSARSNVIGWIDKQDKFCEWLYARLAVCVDTINQKYWNFDLEYIPPLQYTKYLCIGDHYDSHIDLGEGIHYRKLSFSLQLSDETSYKGCDLNIIECNENVDREKGTIVFFPSYALHKVTPLESGVRNALVGWVCGPPFK